jgi:5-methylcytosine-specific restriction endonuclease McrA
MEERRSLQSIPDDELLRRLGELMGQSRGVEVDIVAHIAEVDERKLYARKAFPSMFAYSRYVLHLSEQEAYLRITVARASRKHPMLLTMLGDGRLHLTAIGKLAPHLSLENRDRLLERATHLPKRQLEELIAEIAPRPDVPAMVRKLPERRALLTACPVDPNRAEGSMPELGPEPTLGLRPDSRVELGPDRVAVPDRGNDPTHDLRPDAVLANEPGGPAQEAVGSPKAGNVDAPCVPAAAPAASSPAVALRVSPSVVQPLSPGRYKVQFTASAELHRKLERLQTLMGSGGGYRDLAAVIEQAVTEKLERVETRRFGRTPTPRQRGGQSNPSPSRRDGPAASQRLPDSSSSSRHIPRAVRGAVYERDSGRCRFVDKAGRQCPERSRLEFHHRHPFALGGEHSVANVCLMCRAHNAFLAECDYGRETMARHRQARNRGPRAPAG